MQKVNRFFLFACRQDTFFKAGEGGMDFCIRERENLKRDLNTHCLKTEKVTTRASFRGMSCWTPRQVCPSVNEKDIGFEVPSETGQANLAPPTIPRVCYISVPWVPLSLRPTTASRGWKIKSKEEENKSCQLWKIEGVRAKLIWSESLRPGKNKNKKQKKETKSPDQEQVLERARGKKPYIHFPTLSFREEAERKNFGEYFTKPSSRVTVKGDSWASWSGSWIFMSNWYSDLVF